jgi:hypothetical protein
MTVSRDRLILILDLFASDELSKEQQYLFDSDLLERYIRWKQEEMEREMRSSLDAKGTLGTLT